MELNNRESIYGFCSWLTTRDGAAVKMGSSEDCAGITDLIEEFASVNNLDHISSSWPQNLRHPTGEFSHIKNKEWIMISKTIKRIMVNYPERLREAILTNEQLTAFKAVAKYCRAEPVRACSILPEKSSSHKSVILHNLWKKGYIERRRVNAPTGGHEFEYWPVSDLVE